MTLNRFEIEVESKIANLPQITSFIDDTLMRFQIDESTIHKVQLAVDEACANIIKHAYSGVAGPLNIALEVSGKEITIIIKDKGGPFDPSSAPPPDLSSDLHQRKIGGLGIHLIQNLMDSVNYSFSSGEGNQLVLRKSAQTSSG